MTKNWSFAKIMDILLKKMRSVIVSQNHYLNKIIDVHPLWKKFLQWLYLMYWAASHWSRHQGQEEQAVHSQHQANHMSPGSLSFWKIAMVIWMVMAHSFHESYHKWKYLNILLLFLLLLLINRPGVAGAVL